MAPSSENNPAIVPDEASTSEMISGLPLSGQPGKAVGHAVRKLTLRHDPAETDWRDALVAGGLADDDWPDRLNEELPDS